MEPMREVHRDEYRCFTDMFDWILGGSGNIFAVALFFLMDIPKLYGEISGRTARKAIEQIRKHNAEALTGDIASSHTGSGVRTEKFSTATLAPETVAGATTVLAEAGATTMLTEPEHLQSAENDRQPPEAMDDFVLENELSYAESVEIIE